MTTMNRRAMLNVGFLVGFLVLVFLYFNRGSDQVHLFTQDTQAIIEDTPVVGKEKSAASGGPNIDALKAMLDFIPKKAGFSCEELFKDTPASSYNMTTSYYKYLDQYYDKATRSGKLPVEEYRALHYTVGRRFVKNVCETGFNAGCSSFYALTASDRTVVHSFELGGDLYRKHVADWLLSVFNTRFNIHLGDSTKTLPIFAQENPHFRCDYMYVDGGHVYPVAKADMVNFANMANLKNNFIAFDDYPPGFNNPNFGQAWEESVKEGFVKELTRCAYKDFGGTRGVVIGVVVKHPNGSKN